MKKIFLVIFITTSIFTFFGCASTKSASKGNSAATMAKKAGAPDWWFKGNVTDSTGIYAVGVSNFSDAVAAEKAARVDARATLAQVVEVAVNYIGENMLNADGETKKSFKEQSTVISNQILVGSMQVDRFDLDGEVRVLMFQPYEDMLKKFKSSAMKQENETLKNYMAELTVEQFREAMENAVQ